MKLTTPEEMDLFFLRDLKHRLRMMLRDVEKREKQLKKEISFVKGRKVPKEAEIKAACQFYQDIYTDPFEETMKQSTEGVLR